MPASIEELAAAFLGGQDHVAAPDGQRQRFLDHHIQTQLQGQGRCQVVRTRIGGNRRALQLRDRLDHTGHVLKDLGPPAE
jgi:hypothetical protein